MQGPNPGDGDGWCAFVFINLSLPKVASHYNSCDEERTRQ